MIELINPKELNSFYNLDKKWILPPDTIFVFGSNLAGRHGKGAALTAVEQYGAKYGCGVGLHGNSYAIPTKDENLNVLPLKIISCYVKEFVEFSKKSGKKFYVTPVGTGLAGFNNKEMAVLFDGARNCWFPMTWIQWLI